MQGIEVQGMIVWTIYREDGGPMKAYKNLGNDLKKNIPNQSNDKLITMSNAIVRNCIANSTINEIIKNRKVIRDTVRKEMTDVVKGWGVWIETIEITDVKILSGSLFKDLQCKFREEQKKTAEMEKLAITDQVKTEKLLADAVMSKKRNDSANTQAIYKANKELEVSKEQAKIFIKQKQIEKEKYESDRKSELVKHQKWVETQEKINTTDMEYRLSLKNNEIKKNETDQKVKKSAWDLVQKAEEQSNKMKEIEDKYQRGKVQKTLKMREPYFSDKN